ncbi:MAG: hypothetical protein R3E96_08090 [Planctomycetota bacterium]
MWPCTERLPLVIFTSSGGARMHEGVLSLMQMAKTSAALASLNDAGGFSVCVMTNPTTGGVTASFASVCDITLAEPGALIGFAGPRVISSTPQDRTAAGFPAQRVPEGQGPADDVVSRDDIRGARPADRLRHRLLGQVRRPWAIQPSGRPEAHSGWRSQGRFGRRWQCRGLDPVRRFPIFRGRCWALPRPQRLLPFAGWSGRMHPGKKGAHRAEAGWAPVPMPLQCKVGHRVRTPLPGGVRIAGMGRAHSCSVLQGEPPPGPEPGSELGSGFQGCVCHPVRVGAWANCQARNRASCSRSCSFQTAVAIGIEAIANGQDFLGQFAVVAGLPAFSAFKRAAVVAVKALQIVAAALQILRGAGGGELQGIEATACGSGRIARSGGRSGLGGSCP